MRKRFETHDLVRISVEVTEEAEKFLHASNHQGRLLALALSEKFGALGCVEKIIIDLDAKRHYFPNTPYHDEQLLVITAKHQYSQHIEDHRWLVNAKDVTELHETSKLPLFLAGVLADELVRLYPHRALPVADVVDDVEVEEQWQQDSASAS